VARRALNVVYPPFLPAHGDLRVDATGAIWLADHQPYYERPPLDWTVFDRDGHRLGRITSPAGFTIDQIGDDFVLGRWSDELEVEHVRLYSLLRR
jgi:hypothetical protein